MSDNWGSADDTVFDDSDEIKPNWLWLRIGYLLTVLMLVVSIFFRASGELAWLLYMGFWALSMATYLVPFALFAMKDFDVRAKNPAEEISGDGNLRLFRTSLLIFGFIVSMIFVYLAAEEISRNLNAVT
jgi:hypothetical protein